MDQNLVIIIAVVAGLLVLVAFIGGYMRRARMQAGPLEFEAEGPPTGRFNATDAKFDESVVDSRNTDITMKKTEATKSKFKFR